MNEFIQFRNRVYDNESNDSYPLQFLDEYINNSKAINSDEAKVIEQIQTIKQLELNKQLSEKEIDELLSFLGEHSTTARFVKAQLCLESVYIIINKHVVFPSRHLVLHP